MKVEEAVYESLIKYPSLYAFKDYEKSKFAVLHHCFIVLGNGIEWAYTKNPKDAGYLTALEYKYSKRNDEYTQLYNKPYNKSGIVIDKKLLNRACTEELYYVWSKDLKDFKKKHPNVWESELDTVDLTEWQVQPCRNYNLMQDQGTYPYDQPYPNFQKEYSCFWEDGVEFIQDDWRKAAIEHLDYWRKWHQDYDKLLLNAQNPVSHYYTPESIERRMKKNEGKNGFLQKEYYDEKYNWHGDYAVLSQLLNLETSQKAVEFCTETLIKLGWTSTKKPTGLFYVYDRMLKLYKCLFGWDKDISQAHAWDKFHAEDFKNYHNEKEFETKRFVLKAQTN
jgi:hypothetical protein